MKPALVLFLVLFSIFSHPAILLSQSVDQNSSLADLALARANLSSLERDLDPMHMGLVEALDSLADQLILVGRFEQAHRALDRAVQIIRINEGLYTASQLPYQRKKTLNIINSGNWGDAREQLSHLFWLYSKKTEFATSQLITDLSLMSDMHLRGVSEDSSEYQAFHLRRGSSASWMALVVAEALLGTDNPLLVPIIYKSLNHVYLEKVATEQFGATSRSLREIGVGTGRLREVEYMDVIYYRLGSRLLNQIKDIYSAVEPADPEAVAMAQLYIADWNALFKQNENALAAYEEVFANLSESIGDEALVNAFFERPKLLPEPRFYPSLEQALADSNSLLTNASLSEIEISDKLVFTEWSPNFPFVQQPVTLPPQMSISVDFMVFSFNIGGVEENSKFLRRSNRASIGAAQDLLMLQPEDVPVPNELKSKIQSLRFRPKLVDGVPQQADATLVYIPASSL